MDAFEEVVNVEDIARLPDPLKERLLEIVRPHARTRLTRQGPAHLWPIR